ncbi:glycerophosphodiester phosphodiesterase [Phenylobacterium immobile]|uniref:glycerophosphodiester phosphodiesterase n=1 Tax=Phenylobacterium immobile TaxID=21 RepID=UPI000A84A49B|nr:glycerophosphodiester phosphodiesterase [Phenylobacterium immobile]
MRILKTLILGASLVLACVGAASAQTPMGREPIIIGHRGASGERPEHTASSYRLAIAQGADFIEPDLVMTRDGVLVDRHENEIGGTTDVAAHREFVGRKTVKTVDGQRIEGWFTEDFTLDELKTLRARELLPQLRPASAAFDGVDPILTFAEVLDLARTEGARRGRVVGVYAELKHPSYFDDLGLPMEAKLAAAVRAFRLDDPAGPFILQSFEPGALRKVRARIAVRQVLLMSPMGAPADSGPNGPTYAQLATPGGLAAVARYADGIGPDKIMVLPRDAAGRSAPVSSLVRDAHAMGLFVHPYTFRRENVFLPVDLRSATGEDPASLAAAGDLRTELFRAFDAGVDGVFSDFPGLAVAARAEWLAKAKAVAR